MNERFVVRMRDSKVRHDTALLADFVEILCSGQHRDRRRHPAATDATSLGVYGTRAPVLCDECESHLAYAEQRRAYCPKDPKPFCAHCDTHCYKPDEREWQRAMMRYSGPKSWRKGHALDGLRHALEARRFRRRMQRHETIENAEGSASGKAR